MVPSPTTTTTIHAFNMTNLHDLPVDLLYQIHHLSLSPSLPYVNRTLHSLLSRPTTARAVQFIFSTYANAGSGELMVKALRHGICSLDVVRGIEDGWRRRGKRWEEIHHPKPPLEDSELDESTIQPLDGGPTPLEPPDPPLSPENPYQPLACLELPRRLFRTSPSVSPLLLYLFTYSSSPDPNSYRGYPLSRACLVGNHDLIRFLLDKGADPGMKDGLAMMVAISKKDIKMVKMLFEREMVVDSTVEYSQDVVVDTNGRTNKRKRLTSSDSSIAKRRKRDDTRMTMTPELMKRVMSCGSREIIDYFVNEKGCIPCLGSIMALR